MIAEWIGERQLSATNGSPHRRQLYDRDVTRGAKGDAERRKLARRSGTGHVAVAPVAQQGAHVPEPDERVESGSVLPRKLERFELETHARELL